MEHRERQLWIYFIGVLFASLAIGYFAYHSSNFSPQALRINSLKPLPF